MIDRLVLEKMYLVDRMSPTVIADELSCGETTVRNNLKKYGIPMRTLSEANRLVKFRSVPISSYFRQFLDGCLLGDGNLYSPVGFQAVYHQDSSQKEFIDYVSNILNSNNYLAQTYDYDRFDRRTGREYHSYSVNSVFSTELQEQCNRWYKDGIKNIPKDLVVTPMVVLMFYLGDGQKDKRCKNSVLSSECFTRTEVSWLVLLLNNVGIDCHIQKDGRIRIPSSGFDSLINYMGGCPVECYKYKFSN